MPNAASVTPIAAAYTLARGPLSVDDAVRAALSHRPAEAKSFGNEDDVEGPRRSAVDIELAPPTP